MRERRFCRARSRRMRQSTAVCCLDMHDCGIAHMLLCCEPAGPPWIGAPRLSAPPRALASPRRSRAHPCSALAHMDVVAVSACARRRRWAASPRSTPSTCRVRPIARVCIGPRASDRVDAAVRLPGRSVAIRRSDVFAQMVSPSQAVVASVSLCSQQQSLRRLHPCEPKTDGAYCAGHLAALMDALAEREAASGGGGRLLLYEHIKTGEAALPPISTTVQRHFGHCSPDRVLGTLLLRVTVQRSACKNMLYLRVLWRAFSHMCISTPVAAYRSACGALHRC
jgi:hypothetical protein